MSEYVVHEGDVIVMPDGDRFVIRSQSVMIRKVRDLGAEPMPAGPKRGFLLRKRSGAIEP